MECRVCGSICEEREKVHECRAETIRSLLKKEPYDLKKDTVLLYECPNCGLVQTKFLLNSDCYEEYEDGNGALQYYGDRRILDQQFSNLKKYALKIAGKYFARCTGVEPSEKEIQIAQNMPGGGENTFQLICAYFDRSLNLKDTYDAFCTFQVFEHMEQLQEAVRYAYDILNEGGVGLINVPNGQQIFEEGLYHQINWEHINYFTPYSLALLCNSAGFEILLLESDYEAIELNIYVKKAPRRLSLDACRNKLKQELNQALSGCRTFAVYGAGAKTISYGDLIEQEKLLHVFDSDPAKTGKYVAGLKLPVEHATQQACGECDAVIIFASSYNREIIALLSELGYTGKIFYFEGNKVRKA